MSVDNADAVPLIVQRWKRFGHDRAYVKRGDDDLGYRNLLTGEVCSTKPGCEALVESATAGLLARVNPPPTVAVYEPRHALLDGPAERAAMPSPAPPAGPGAPDRDLALNRPGQSAREQATALRDAAPLKTFFSRVVGAKTDERAWRIGADGEYEVAHQLAKLDPSWRVLHAVPVGARGSDIDHVVIGPSGVFTLNAKNHPQAAVWVAGDTVNVNNFSQRYVRNSRHEAKRAAALLSAAAGFDVEVQGVVVVIGAHRGFTVREQPRDGAVVVTTRKQVRGVLRDRPAVLGGPSIDRIYEVARRLSTWQP